MQHNLLLMDQNVLLDQEYYPPWEVLIEAIGFSFVYRTVQLS